MSRKVHAVLVDVYNEDVKVVDVNDELQEFYKLLNCDCIDIQCRKIGDKYFDVICDDEGLLKCDPKISAIDTLGNVMFVGNLLITQNNGSGKTISLSADDVEMVCQHIRSIPTRMFPDGYNMLTCAY